MLRRRATAGPLVEALPRVTVAVSLLLLVACGETVPRPASQEPNELVLTEPDGTTLTLRPDGARCGPSEYDPEVQVVGVHDSTRRHNLVIEVVPSDVTGGKDYDLPVSAGDMESGPHGAFIFFGGKDFGGKGFEVSTVQEESTGSLEVVRASCDPVALELTIDATLASEYSDGGSLDVRGHLDLSSSPADPR